MCVNFVLWGNCLLFRGCVICGVVLDLRFILCVRYVVCSV